MLSDILRRGVGGVGLTLYDDFNRANTSGPNGLGVTSTGGVPWEVVHGNWYISSNRAFTSTARTENPIAVVNTKHRDADISVDVSTAGGDCLYGRVVDATNWIRLRQFRSSYSCNPYNCNPYNCNPYNCNPYSCNCSSCCNTRYECGVACDGVPVTTYDCACPPWCQMCPQAGCSSCYNINCRTFGASCPLCGSYACNCSTCYNTCYQTCWNTCWDTCYTYTTFFEKSVNGTVSEIQSWSSSHSRLRLVMVGTSVTVFTNVTNRGTFTVADHLSARKHGIGRGTSSNNGHTIDNFSSAPPS